MLYKELNNELNDYSLIYHNSYKKELVDKCINDYNIKSFTYNCILIKCGYKFLDLKEFQKMCESDSCWPAELKLSDSPDIRVNAYSFVVLSSNIRNKISIWNDINTNLYWYKCISFDINKKKSVNEPITVITSFDEIRKVLFAISDNIIYTPIECNPDDDYTDVDVSNDINEILNEDVSDENVDSYTNEIINDYEEVITDDVK